jgi:Flp pilus assembly protein TadD
VRRKRYDDAVASLGEATRLNPANTHYSYVYAVALNSVGRTEQALSVLKQAQEHNPVNRELLLALVDINHAAGNLAAATTYAKTLTALAPTDAALQKLLSDLTAQSEPKPTDAAR